MGRERERAVSLSLGVCGPREDMEGKGNYGKIMVFFLITLVSPAIYSDFCCFSFVKGALTFLVNAFWLPNELIFTWGNCWLPGYSLIGVKKPHRLP